MADNPQESSRNLSAAEVSELRRLYWPKRTVSLADLKTLTFFAVAGTLLSTPFALLFWAAAYFMHDYPLVDALHLGVLGLLPGVVIGIAVAVIGWLGTGGTSLPGFKGDLSTGYCVSKRYPVLSFRGVIDSSDPEKRDTLLEVGENMWLALPWAEASDESGIREVLTVWRLPQSGIVVATEFDGERIPAERGVIETPGFWRNDDLPFYEAIELKDVPEELRSVIQGVP